MSDYDFQQTSSLTFSIIKSCICSLITSSSNPSMAFSANYDSFEGFKTLICHIFRAKFLLIVIPTSNNLNISETTDTDDSKDDTDDSKDDEDCEKTKSCLSHATSAAVAGVFPIVAALRFI